MKHKSSFLATFACAISLTGLSSAATIVGVDVAGGAYTGIGVLDTTSRAWVSKTANGNTFSLDGVNDVTLGLSGWDSDGSADAAINLFDNYKHNGGSGTATFSLSGLDNTKTYSIVLYSAQNSSGGRGGLWDLTTGNYTGTDPQESTGNQQATFANGENYVRYDNIQAVDGVISFTAANGLTTGNGIAVFNGFEIQSVPEPSAALLGGLGVLALLRRRR